MKKQQKQEKKDKPKFSMMDKFLARMFCPELTSVYMSEEKPKKEKENKSESGIFSFYKEKKQEQQIPEAKITNNQSNYIFSSIIGHEDIKIIFQNLITSGNNVSILLSGSAGCGKSMFLKEIQKFFPDETYYIDGSRASKAGIFEVLFNDTTNSIKYLLIDELDKLSMSDQEALLTLIQDGKLVQTLKTGIKSKECPNLSVIGASNHEESILYPLLTRFYVIGIPDYSVMEFKQIGKKILTTRYGLEENISTYIVDKVIQLKKKPNIRDVEKIAKLCNNDLDMVDLLISKSSNRNYD